ncbi:hypothetical protein C2845_PM13G02130 [Panicum miliaceum]|uniref:Uncharacterized protein n=1 Tax=Panicum miliaceum TaxID=4540 RepID=A0A3L6RH45_PANMI|nr:hypothetical protein C2845_PM13G02130 [Panicum miliaceum]
MIPCGSGLCGRACVSAQRRGVCACVRPVGVRRKAAKAWPRRVRDVAATCAITAARAQPWHGGNGQGRNERGQGEVLCGRACARGPGAPGPRRCTTGGKPKGLGTAGRGLRFGLAASWGQRTRVRVLGIPRPRTAVPWRGTSTLGSHDGAAALRAQSDGSCGWSEATRRVPASAAARWPDREGKGPRAALRRAHRRREGSSAAKGSDGERAVVLTVGLD